MTGLHKFLFGRLQSRRHRFCLGLLDKSAKTLLDLGCGNGAFVQLARTAGYDASGTDAENDVATARQTADIITCFEVLEHLPDPVRALQNLSRLYRRQLIITVPNEPWFSLWRLSWEPEHLWAVTPAALKTVLGPPAYEKTIVLNRYYVGVWRK